VTEIPWADDLWAKAHVSINQQRHVQGILQVDWRFPENFSGSKQGVLGLEQAAASAPRELSVPATSFPVNTNVGAQPVGDLLHFTDTKKAPLYLFCDGLDEVLNQILQRSAENARLALQGVVIVLCRPDNVLIAFFVLFIAFLLQNPKNDLPNGLTPGNLWPQDKNEDNIEERSFFHWSFLIVPGAVFTEEYVQDKAVEWGVSTNAILHGLGKVRNNLISFLFNGGKIILNFAFFSMFSIVCQPFGCLLQYCFRQLLVFLHGFGNNTLSLALKQSEHTMFSVLSLVSFYFIGKLNAKICDNLCKGFYIRSAPILPYLYYDRHTVLLVFFFCLLLWFLIKL
jgi:hypothetical protein